MSCRSPRAAEKTGKTSSLAASAARSARARAPPSRPAVISFASRRVPTKRPGSASRAVCATPPTPGATTSIGTSSSTTRAEGGRLPRVTSVRPVWAIEGGRVTLEGEGLPVDPFPHVRVGAQPARVAAAAPTFVAVLIPPEAEGGTTAVRIDERPGETAFVEIGVPLVTGVHHVDSPAYDRHGNLYVTFSGSRGQQAPVAIFIVRPDGTREPFVTDLANPTSLAFDYDGHLFVSSRFDG